MKTFRYILIVIVAFFALILIVAAILPKDFTVTRSVFIHAPKRVVMKQLKSQKSFNEHWSPWAELDPNATYTYEGNDGKIGSVTEWKGNNKFGAGRMEAVSMTDSRVESKINFYEPFKSEASSSYEAEQTGDSVKVTWTFSGRMKYPLNIMLILGMEKGLGDNFEHGLNKLKAYCEEQAAIPFEPIYKVQEINFEPRTYLTYRKEINIDQVGVFFQENIHKVLDAGAQAGMPPAGIPTAIYYTWDTAAKKTDMAVAVPVQGAIRKLDGFANVNVGPAKALLIDFTGSYDYLHGAHATMEKYMAEKNLSPAYILEEYWITPERTADPDELRTRVIYVLK